MMPEASVGAGLGINIDCCYQRFYKTRPDRCVGIGLTTNIFCHPDVTKLTLTNDE